MLAQLIPSSSSAALYLFVGLVGHRETTVVDLVVVLLDVEAEETRDSPPALEGFVYHILVRHPEGHPEDGAGTGMKHQCVRSPFGDLDLDPLNSSDPAQRHVALGTHEQSIAVHAVAAGRDAEESHEVPPCS